ncbi:MAG TPA: xylulokinase [Polyangiaceae bacterium]|jgi:xylulokinase|nr:xylulokinase [Polyangiaceae bacterium]
MPLVLGVDSSTQSTKVEVRDADTGALVASGRAPHPPTTPPRSEQDPAAWWAALQEACAGAGLGPAATGSGARRVAAASIAAQQMGLVALDAQWKVVRPAKLWNDTESAPQARRLVETLGPAAWAQACGSVPVASFTITKLAWLAEREPASWARLAHACVPHDWLTWRLTGRFVTDRGDASGTGWWSPAEETYREDLLALVAGDCDWRAALPEVLGPLEAAGPLAPDAARDLGAAPGAVAAAGTGDNMAAALGAGLGPGDVAISLGTSGTVYAVADRAVMDPTGLVGGFADATGRFLPLACTLNATKVTDTFARVLGLDRDAFDRAALEAPAGAGGLVLVPYLDGERTPNRPDARGVLAGLRSDVTPGQIARASVEGVVCGLLDALDALAAAGVDTSGRLVLVGGGARSRAYRRAVADLAGRPIRVPRDEELVAKGACVQAAAVLHGRPPAAIARAWRGEDDVVDPDPAIDAPAIRAAYRRARDAAYPVTA